MNATKIEWCEATWNPVTGCSPVSAGCQNCWAKRMANRQRGRNGYPADDPFRVTFHADRLDEPLRMKKRKRIAVCLMGDICHGDVPAEWIDKVFGIMHWASWHTFLILTKRPERLAAYLRWEKRPQHIMWEARFRASGKGSKLMNDLAVCRWPLPNVWLGTSVENRDSLDRVRRLQQCSAAVRFLSLEPLLGPIAQLPLEGIHWVIVGGESGPGARPMHPDWVRSIRDQCQAAGVPFFFKQWGSAKPDVLEVREWERAGRDFSQPKGGRLLHGREWNEMPKVGN
jgi:protein gp37